MPVVEGADCVCVDTGSLENLYIGKPVHDPPADFQISRPASLPAPLFQRARRYQPPLGQTLLIEMLHNPMCSSP